MNLYTRMGVSITEEEVGDLIDEIGDPENSQVYEDNLLRAVIGKDLRFKTQGMNKAMIKLRGASSPSLGEFINSFSNMPENYFLSFTETLVLYSQNLPTSTIQPLISSSAFYYTNLYPPTNSANQTALEAKNPEFKNFQNHNLSTFIRVTVPNFLVKLSLERATGIPLPAAETLKNAHITNRCLRVCLLKNKTYLGNIAEIPARYDPDYEDRWYFNKMDSLDINLDANAYAKDELGTLSMFGGLKSSQDLIIKKDNYDVSQDVGIELILELVVSVKRKDCKNEIMMSNGFAKVKLADLQKKSSFALDVQGGDPVSNELRINPDEIRRGRKGFFACFACMFEGKVTPKLDFEVSQKFSAAEKQMVGVLPD